MNSLKMNIALETNPVPSSYDLLPGSLGWYTVENLEDECQIILCESAADLERLVCTASGVRSGPFRTFARAKKFLTASIKSKSVALKYQLSRVKKMRKPKGESL